MKTVLVTGAMGFVGLNFIKMAKMVEREWNIIAVDSITYAANNHLAGAFFANEGVKFHREDITNYQQMKTLIIKYHVDVVVNFAAESHVDRSIDNPLITMKSNFDGVFTLLRIAKFCKDANAPFKFIQMSTDEVYGDAVGREQGFKEGDAFHPSSPYAASKAAGDCLIESFVRTYGLDCKIVHSTNLYGLYQQSEKFIPKVVSQALAGQKTAIYGNGSSARYWLHVSDLCNGILDIIEQCPFSSIDPMTYSFSGEARMYDKHLAKLIIEEVFATKDTEVNEAFLEDMLVAVPGRPGQDLVYWLDDSSTRQHLNWAPEVGIGTGIRETVRWLLENKERLDPRNIYQPGWNKQ